MSYVVILDNNSSVEGMAILADEGFEAICGLEGEEEFAVEEGALGFGLVAGLVELLLPGVVVGGVDFLGEGPWGSSWM
jgi:hypothetical protein